MICAVGLLKIRFILNEYVRQIKVFRFCFQAICFVFTYVKLRLFYFFVLLFV